jgi:RNA polymerase sigma-70 factor (ECF subfamily)
VVFANFSTIVKIVISLIFVTLVASSLRALDDSLLKSQPPVVIKTFPVSGYDAVDPEIKTIKVIFNKKMTPKSWSFVQLDKKTFPALIGSPSFDKSLHTCTMKVNLKPGTTYIIWLNKGSFQNFKDATGRSAVPYLLAFRTAGKNFMLKKKAALTAAKTWLNLLDSAKFADTWKNADPYFKHRIKERKWVAQMPQLSKKIGKFVSRKLLSANFTNKLPGLPGRSAFVLRYSSCYKHQSQAIETVVPIIGSDGVWRVSGYYIK